MKRNGSLKTYLSTSLIIAILCIAITSYVYSSGSEIGIEKDSFIKSASFIIENDDGTIKAFSGTTGALVYSGSDFPTVLNNAMDGLTSGRTWKQKIVFKSDIYEIDFNAVERQIWIPNYTILDFAGSILKVKDDTGYDDDYGILRNKDTPATDIEIRNFKFEDNEEGAPDPWGYILWFTRTSNMIIDNCDFRSSTGWYQILFDGTPVGNSVTITRCKFSQNYPVFNNNDMDFSHNYFEVDELLTFTGTTTFTFNRGHGDVEVGLESDGCVASYNNITQTAGSSILYTNGENVIFIGNRIWGFGGINTYGIDISGGGGKNCIVSNNRVDNVGFSIVMDTGSEAFISGNIVTNSQQGIYLKATTNCLIKNNVLDTCLYGLKMFGSGYLNHTIESNTFIDCTTPIDIAGSGHIIRWNVGFVTENSGIGIDLANADTIAHGLAGAPSSVRLTSLNITYDGEPLIVSWDQENTDSTNISVDIYWVNGTAITDSVIDISWFADYKP